MFLSRLTIILLSICSIITTVVFADNPFIDILGGVVLDVPGALIGDHSRAIWFLSSVTPPVVMLVTAIGMIIEMIVVQYLLKISWLQTILRMSVINLVFYTVNTYMLDGMVMQFFPHSGSEHDQLVFSILAFLVVLVIRVIISCLIYLAFDMSADKKRLILAMVIANALSSAFFIFFQIIYYYQNSSAYKFAKFHEEHKGPISGLFGIFKGRK